ncbi:hypothetical protein CC78DRAFT_579563 [Lojkania enalia]|uniref:PHD-type domain-containing protein n=1 Tax=Lojkania enalia TaxID=147567 RepID=A0A9P4KCC1_9PLEO|nr:hypothetical protein CC78DRAFT_579563 [Didymosphaeria enalia]
MYVSRRRGCELGHSIPSHLRARQALHTPRSPAHNEASSSSPPTSRQPATALCLIGRFQIYQPALAQEKHSCARWANVWGEHTIRYVQLFLVAATCNSFAARPTAPGLVLVLAPRDPSALQPSPLLAAVTLPLYLQPRGLTALASSQALPLRPSYSVPQLRCSALIFSRPALSSRRQHFSATAPPIPTPSHTLRSPPSPLALAVDTAPYMSGSAHTWVRIPPLSGAGPLCSLPRGAFQMDVMTLWGRCNESSKELCGRWISQWVATAYVHRHSVKSPCSLGFLHLGRAGSTVPHGRRLEALCTDQALLKAEPHRRISSTDWHLPSPSSTPKSVTFPDSTSNLKTPKAEVAPQSHFLDAWSTPRVNGQQTPAQTPSFALSTPVERPSSSYSQKIHTPDDPEFHVNHFTPSNLPLPPVDPSRRLSSSPDPLSVKDLHGSLRKNPSLGSRPVSMDTSQMQTPPPTRDATSRRGAQQGAGHEFTTPATVIARMPNQAQPSDGLFNQTPLGFPSLQFSPDLVQFPSAGPMSAPALPQSRLFWDQPSDDHNMDVDMPIVSDPFGPTPHKVDDLNWQTFHTPNQMNPQAFQALHGVSSPGPTVSFSMNNAGSVETSNSRPSSFISTSGGVDPSMLFSFSSPGPTASINNPTQQANINYEGRLPYETQARQARDALREREAAKSQHSRTNTSSSTASFESLRPGLQRSNTDSGFRSSRPSSMESKSSGSAVGFNIPRRSSPLKRQSGGSLMSIPEVRRPRTRLVVDDSGRARTETIPAEGDKDSIKDTRIDSQKDFRRQYPGLWNDEDSESESEEPLTLSRNPSFDIPQRRSSKHARADSNGIDRANSFKIPRPSSGMFDKSSFETIRPIRPTKKVADNPFRRYSMMDFPTSYNDNKDSDDQQMPDSPGNALGALKKVVEGRQKRIDHASQNTLKAHNQRWAQASTEFTNASNSPHGLHDPYSSGFNASPANTTDGVLTTPSTDRSSLSSESTRCVCNAIDDGRPMVQCESCNKWLHMACVGLNVQNLPPVYVCIFCTGQTPIARGGRIRGPLPQFDSPLTHKSVFRR